MLLSQIWIYSLISVLLVSLISLIGIVSLSINAKKLHKFLIYLISLSAGTLLGDAFFHLLPEVSQKGLALSSSIFILLGITLFLFLEKVIHWQHCHAQVTEDKHIHVFGYTNLIGDALHNFIDGLIIAASYLVSLPAGIATTIAVIAHEIPQEIGDFSVLLHAGFSKSRALMLNFLTALAAVLGTILALALTNISSQIESFLVPLAIGGFIYIAGSDLIPEIHKHSDNISKSLLQLIFFLIGIGLMYLLLFLE